MKIDYIELPTKDIAASKAFYQRLCGWSYQDWGPDYADTQGSGLGSGLNADPAHATAGPLVVLHAADLEAAERTVLEAGGRICRPAFSFPGGRRFHFTDPAGHELAVWSEN